MYAYEIPGLRFSGVAKEKIARYTFVAPASTGDYTVAAAGKPVVGVAMNDPEAGEVLEIADGIVKVIAEEAIAAGDQVMVGTAGKAKKCTDGVGAVGIAIVTAKANEQTTVKIG